MTISGKVAVATGSGGGGGGRAIALRLAREGAAVMVSDVDESGGEETLRLLRSAGARAAFCRADVAREDEVRELFAKAEAEFGGVDLLVNNASAPFAPGAPMAEWLHTINVDLVGALHATRFAVEAMRRRGGGAIVNISSTSALCHGRRRPQGAAYDVAKVGLLRLTTALASLSETDNIRVNCLLPDWIATPEVKAYFDQLPPEQKGRDGVPVVLTSLDEIGDALVALAMNATLAGRALVIWSGGARGLIPFGDPGYASLEPEP